MVDLRVHVETLASKVGEAGGVAALAGEGVGAGGPEGVLAHHLGLGVAVAGVEAVGPAGHRLLGPHRGVAEDLPGVAGAQLGAHAAGQPRLLAPLATLALVVQTPPRTLPDAPEVTQGHALCSQGLCLTHLIFNVLLIVLSVYSLGSRWHGLVETNVREAVPGATIVLLYGWTPALDKNNER